MGRGLVAGLKILLERWGKVGSQDCKSCSSREGCLSDWILLEQ